MAIDFPVLRFWEVRKRQYAQCQDEKMRRTGDGRKKESNDGDSRPLRGRIMQCLSFRLRGRIGFVTTRAARTIRICQIGTWMRRRRPCKWHFDLREVDGSKTSPFTHTSMLCIPFLQLHISSSLPAIPNTPGAKRQPTFLIKVGLDLRLCLRARNFVLVSLIRIDRRCFPFRGNDIIRLPTVDIDQIRVRPTLLL